MKIPGLLQGLLFNESRKFGLGLWVVLLATLIYFYGSEPRMTLEMWQSFILLASILIGGGTLADTALGKKAKKDDPAPPAQ